MSFENYIPRQFLSGAEAAAAAIGNLDDTLVATHVNMDGDALGSWCACGEILTSLGRRFALYSSSGVPNYLDFVQLPGKVYQTLEELPFAPKTAIYVDCNDVARLGTELGRHIRNWQSINIDHHIGGRGLGSIVNYIESDAAASAQLVAYVALAMGLKLSGKLAEDIALGLMTDTGGFCHGNTTADVFSLCALLVNNGFNMSGLREHLQNSWTIGRAHLWGRLFGRVRLEFHDRIAFCPVELADLRHYHCSVDDLEGLIDQFRKIRGVDVAVLLREENPQSCKFSLRSQGSVDVRKMAAMLGGGGHQNASGGRIETNLQDSTTLLLEIIRQNLELDDNQK